MAGVKTEVDVAWNRFLGSNTFHNWQQDNPGEFERIENYKQSDGPEPNGISTEFGLGLLALVNAGKLGDGTYQGI